MGYALVSVVVGACIVLQNGWNRRLAEPFGLSTTLVWNSIAVLLLSLLLYAVAALRPGWLPELFRPQGTFTGDWRLALPGVAGFLIVSGMPLAISRIGAVATVSIVIAVQILAAAIWDGWMENVPLTTGRLLGALLAAMGAVVALRG